MSTLKAVTNARLGGVSLTSGLSATSNSQGHTVIDKSSSLTRLNYFDGKFLRATDLQLEQAALLSQVRLASQAAGGGVIHGFDCTLAGGDNISIGAGLAYDWQGRALVLSQSVELAMADLIALSKNALSKTSSTTVSRSTRAQFADCEIRADELSGDNILGTDETYLIVINHIEAFCGEEDVFGKLCSEACVSSTQRTHIVEGIQVSAVPLSLIETLKQSSAVTLTQKHLRSRIASAFFAQEQGSIASLITQQGLNANTWCLGAELLAGQGIPIGMVSRAGTSTVFLDAWSVRRERVESPPQQYWAARMGMRSWRIFLAQLLQFQCQLRDCLGTFGGDEAPPTSDPCADEKVLLQSAAGDMQQLLNFYTQVSSRLVEVQALPVANFTTLDADALQASIGRLQAAGVTQISQQLLIDCGIVELPSAGYLPVVADSSMTINQQVRQLLGAGVDLRFCSVRPDFVQHAMEEAQHMQRICLLSGLDDEENIQEVDILVPDGIIAQSQTEVASPGFQAHLDSSDTMLGMLLHMVGDAFRESLDEQDVRNDLLVRTATRNRRINLTEIRVSQGNLNLGETMSGAARADVASASKALYLATESAVSTTVEGQTIDAAINFWGQMQTDLDPFSLASGGRTNISSRFIMEVSLDYVLSDRQVQIDMVIELNISGQLIIEAVNKSDSATQLSGRFIGDCFLQYTTVSNGEAEVRVDSSSLSDTISLNRNITALGPDITIVIPSPALFGDIDAVDMIYEQKWNAAGEAVVRGYLRAKTDQGNSESNFLSGTFVPDADVLKPGNPFYSKSLVAINNVAGALDNSGFVEVANNLLFPPPVLIPDDLRVTGSYPWVLFHRRRDKICEQAVAPDVIAPPRNYEVYHVVVDDGVSTDELVASIDASLDNLVANAVAVAVADYAPNSQVVTTAHQNLQNSWTGNAGENARVLVGVIASRGDVLAEGSALATARLMSVNNVLAPVADIGTNIPLISRETVPQRLGVGDVDGVIIYFSQIAQVETDCHAIYQVLSTNPDEVGRQIDDAIAKYNSGSTTTTLDVVFNNDNARRLAITPDFVTGEAQFASAEQQEQLKKEWAEVGGMLVTHAGAVYPVENEAIADTVAQQSEMIVQTVGALSDSAEENRAQLPVPAGMLGDCQRATILLTATQCHDVYLVASARRDDQLIPGAIPDDNTRAQLDILFSAVDAGYRPGQATYYSLGELNYYWDNALIESQSAAEFNSNWQDNVAANVALQRALTAATRIEFYSAIRMLVDNDGNPNFEPDVDQAKSQNEALGSMIIAGRPTEHNSLATEIPDFPTNCPVVTFVLVDPVIDRIGRANDFATSVNFNENNEVIRDQQFERTLREFAATNASIERIEIATEAGVTKRTLQTRAQALKAVLLEEGVATRASKVEVVEREANEANAGKKINLVLR